MKLKKPFCIWFTGLSGSGKSTLAEEIEKRLERIGIGSENLDGDEIRKELSYDLGFSMEDRKKNNERIIFISKVLVRNGVPTLVAFISPLNEIRDTARDKIQSLILVYVQCSLEECIKRDVKGLYKKALAGEIKEFTGIDSIFEEPINPEIIVDTENNSIEDCADKIWEYLIDKEFIK
ncbi:MAG TPA: adenylyl-sulfate kinase [Candidatus Dojkabacteria bacterium]|jgi:adenylylsulfate kinase